MENSFIENDKVLLETKQFLEDFDCYLLYFLFFFK